MIERQTTVLEAPKTKDGEPSPLALSPECGGLFPTLPRVLASSGGGKRGCSEQEVEGGRKRGVGSPESGETGRQEEEDLKLEDKAAT